MSYNFKTFYFSPFNELENSPFVLKDMGIEKRNSQDYYFDNTNRDIHGYLFQYTLKGHGILELESQAYKIEPGQAFFVKIPDTDKYYCPSGLDEDGWQYLYLHFEGSAVLPYFEKIMQKTGKVFSLNTQSTLIHYLLTLHENLYKGMRVRPFLGDEIVFNFLSLMCKSVAFNQEDYSIKIHKAIELMETQFAKFNGISQIASKLSISNSHLAREFTKETGITPIHYLTNIRIQNSMHLLMNTDLTMNEIAEKCGFACGNYFSKVFKSYTQQTPDKFRRSKR